MRGKAHGRDAAVQPWIVRGHDFDTRQLTDCAHPQVAQVIEPSPLGRRTAHGPMLFEHQRQGQQCGDVRCAVRRARTNVGDREMHFAHVQVDVRQTLGGNVEKAQRQRRTDPFVQVVRGEGDAQLIEIELQLPQRMGAVEDHVDAMFFGSGGNRLHRHHQPGAVGDVGQGHQLQSWVAREGLAVGGQQAVEAGGVRMVDLDYFDAAMRRQPAHRALDRVVLQVADQHLIARLQAVVVADQRLQTVRRIGGEGDTVGRHADQPGQLRADLQTVSVFEALTRIHRVAAVDQLNVAMIFLDHGARHASEVTILQIDRTRLQIVAIGKGLPKGFITGAAGVVGHGLLNQRRAAWISGAGPVCHVWHARVPAIPTSRCDRSLASGPAGHPTRHGENLPGRTSSGKGRAGRQ
ncbi:hypothetical protein D3C84_642870 [compost metagenome]